MITIDFVRLRREYVWFGWWYHQGNAPDIATACWKRAVHPALNKTKYKVIKINHAQDLIAEWEVMYWDNREGWNYD